MSTENWIDLTQTKFTVTSGSVELNPKLQNILDRSMNGFERYLQLTEYISLKEQDIDVDKPTIIESKE